jgi:hypothetical protein
MYHTICLVSLTALTGAWFTGQPVPSGPPAPALSAPASLVPSPVVTAPLPPLEQPHLDADSTSAPVFDAGDSHPDQPRLWLNADYLIWRIKDAPVSVPLVSTSRDPNDLGRLDLPSSSVLFGNHDTSLGTFSGLRAEAGYRFSSICGVMLSGFALEQQGRIFSAPSDTVGNPLLAVPSLSPFFLRAQSQIVTSPGTLSGGIVVDQHSHLWGSEADLTALLYGDQTCRVTLLAGFRYLDLREGLGLNTATTLLTNPALFNGTPADVGSTFTTRDSFNTRNQFYGAQFGADCELNWGRLFVNLRALLAVGSTSEIVNIRGNSTLTPPGATTPSTTVTGGILAQASNIGHFGRDEFAVVPEVRVNVGLRLTSFLSVYVGYTFLYCSDVMRPGELIDPVVNTNFIPAFGAATGTGLPQPTVQFRSSEFFAHGGNIGFTLSF